MASSIDAPHDVTGERLSCGDLAKGVAQAVPLLEQLPFAPIEQADCGVCSLKGHIETVILGCHMLCICVGHGLVQVKVCPASVRTRGNDWRGSPPDAGLMGESEIAPKFERVERSSRCRSSVVNQSLFKLLPLRQRNAFPRFIAAELQIRSRRFFGPVLDMLPQKLRPLLPLAS